MMNTNAAPLVTRKPEGVRVSIADLAADTGASARQVIKAIEEAQAKGFLDVRDFDGTVGTFKVKLPSEAVR